MHARLSRWRSPPMARGGWYPVVRQELPDVVVRVNGHEHRAHWTVVELEGKPRERAVWAVPAKGPAIVVCPAGHHLVAVAPAQPRARCPYCSREYEIEG